MDEVFGTENFQNEIIWEKTNAHNMPTKTFGKSHDNIFLYSKTDSFVFNKIYSEYGEAQMGRYKPDENGRLYTGRDLTFSTVNEKRQFEWRGTKPPANRSWGYGLEDLEKLWEEGRILTKKDGTPRLDGLKVYLDEAKGKPLTTIWNDVSRVGNTSSERSDYPTQKPEALLERILLSSSDPDDLVLDCFNGSGTTIVTSQKLGRRWIGCDINKGAIQTSAKRLHAVMQEQGEAAAKQKQGKLVEDENAPPKPAQLAFTTWRVNDYDLAVQHNEAVELACEHIGITRTRSDSYFDGRLGNRLVKIIPFNHPLSPLDLEDIDKELKRRPEEQRDVSVVCLGMELAARAWAEQHNQNRPINRYHIIELRTDSKYGGFIKHEPLIASVDVQREDDKLLVEVTDVFSPTIMQRLNMEEGLFRAHIDDWRAVVDCIMIDTDYDGEVFNVALSDIPAKKSDLVEGRYELPAVPAGSTIAVKVIDMLGEEVIVTTVP